jgi:hypothetical protein
LLAVLVCVACFAVCAAAAWAIDRISLLDWIGGADLSVKFIVTDADTGQPIPNARIHIRCDGGWYDEVENDLKAPFDIQTDHEGTATRLLHNARTTGMVSGLRFTNTYHIWIPIWNLQAFAEGYETSDWINLWGDDTRPPFCEADRGVEQNRLEIRISLRKAAGVAGRGNGVILGSGNRRMSALVSSVDPHGPVDRW